MKALLQHPRTAWWLACLLSASPFLILLIAVLVAPTSHPYKQEVTIRTNGTTDDIVATVKNLNRGDLVVTVEPNPVPRNPLLALLYFTVYLTLIFAFCSAMVSSAETKMRKLLRTKTGLTFEND